MLYVLSYYYLVIILVSLLHSQILLERISPHSAAKISIFFELTMKKCKKFNLYN